MNEKRCIITNEPITSENDSRAHVIPSALGGRLKPRGILSENGNGLLGEKIDLPLIQAFQALMTLLDGSRDRGKNRPVRMTDANGRTYIVEFGEPLTLANFAYGEKPVENGTAFRIDARNLKELRTLLGRVKAKHHEFDIDEAMKHAIKVRSWPDGMLHNQLQVGPRSVFPALFVSASIFAVYHGHPPHPELAHYVACFDPDSPKPLMPKGTFYFIPPRPWISTPGEVTHIVAMLASAERQEMLVYFELFNAAPVAVLLPFAGTTDVRATHAVDVLTGAEVPVTIDDDAVREVPWLSTHQLGDAELYDFTQERIGRLIGLAQRRAWDAQIEALMTRAFGADKGQPLTAKDLVSGVAELADFSLLEWNQPLITLERMKEGLRGFDELCSRFEAMVAVPGRATFRASIAPQRRRLETAILNKRRALTV